MLIEILIFLLLGILAGSITGILPGIHINLVGSILLSSTFFLTLHINPFYSVTFIVSMSIAHTFIDFIPSIYLGAPDEDSVLTVLPGHRLLLEGRAHEAVLITLIGSLLAITTILALSPLLITFIPKLSAAVQFFIPYLLILVSIFLILTEKNKFLGLFIFVLASFLGLSALNLPLKDPLLPILTGLFGASSLILSIKQKIKIPQQEIPLLREIKIPKKDFAFPVFFSTIFSSLLGFLPTLGSSQIATISSTIKKQNERQFLFSIGLINTFLMILSFITIFTIDKARTGSAVFIQTLLNEISLQQLIFILSICFASSILSFILAIKISKIFAKNIEKINYTKISFLILIFLSIIVIIFSGMIGFIIFVTSTFLGLTSNLMGVKRTNLIACLLVPTIVLYLF